MFGEYIARRTCTNLSKVELGKRVSSLQKFRNFNLKKRRTHSSSFDLFNRLVRLEYFIKEKLSHFTGKNPVFKEIENQECNNKNIDRFTRSTLFLCFRQLSLEAGSPLL